MRTCLIIVNAYKDECMDYGEIVKQYLETRTIRCTTFLFSDANNTCSFDGHDFCITVGGDGTVLFAARGCKIYLLRGSNIFGQSRPRPFE